MALARVLSLTETKHRLKEVTVQAAWPKKFSAIQSKLLRDSGFWYDRASAFMVRARPLKIVQVEWITNHSVDELRVRIASSATFHFRLTRAAAAKWRVKYAWP